MTDGALIYAVARWLHTPMFFLAVGSEANIGGAATAPVAAAAWMERSAVPTPSHFRTA